ncbi:gamma carbonic anhydrase family protein [Eggerthellaceae bacterium 3-80]
MTYFNVSLDATCFVAKNATLVGDISIGEETLILFNAALRGDYGAKIIVGKRSNIQEGCCFHVSPDFDCVIGDGVTVGHGAIVHGCTVGNNSLIGMGAIVLDDAYIGNNCLVAAGSVVVGGTQVPDGSLVMGSPARVKRALRPEEIEELAKDAQSYTEIAYQLADEGIVYRGNTVPLDAPSITLAR